MARAPRRQSPQFQIDPEPGPLEEAVLTDQMNIADDLTGILEALQGYDQGSIKAVLYRKPSQGIGKYEWIEEIAPPFDLSAIFSELKERFGGGDFQLRIFAGGRIRKNVDFSIVKEKAPLIAPASDKADNMTMMMFQMMMKQSEDASRQRADDMRDRQAAAERQTAMIVSLATAAIPALLGGREKTSDLMQAIAAFQPKNDGNPMKDALETLTLAKGLFEPKGDGEKGAGFDADDIVGSVLKIAGPVAGAVGRAFTGRREAASNPVEVPRDDASQQLMLPQGGPPYEGPINTHGKPQSPYPILDLIRADVLFMFARNHDPQKAADVVYDTIEAAEVTEAEINDLVAAFAVSPDWLGELAAAGIDLRTRPEWANEFLQALVSIHGDVGGEHDDFGRGEGRTADLAPDGETVAGRLQADGSP